ncbi:DUF6093 family protein [Actinacidiphila glaucinigra]|uniref:DUF6093 family protein n=1 Tax=Actinacidiphila glaucinigra TaxID=235986 RepID=UPI0035D94C5C
MKGLAAFLARGRAAAQELQSERIRLWLPGEGTFDRTTGTTTPTVAADYYTGPARVKPVTTSQEVEAGETTVALRDYVVSVPWSTAVGERPVPGALVDVLASPDARMVGLRLWVTDIEHSSTATAWRIRAEDRQ